MEHVPRKNAELFSLQNSPLTVFYAPPAIEDDGRNLSITAQLGIPRIERTPVSQVTVLLVEDDDDLRQITEMFLDMMGYAVVSYGDASLASEAFNSRSDIDLLLTDLQMPGKSGVELARQLTALRPSLPVMIVSGSILSGELAREIRERTWSFLSKPYGLPALVAGLQLLLHPMHQQAA